MRILKFRAWDSANNQMIPHDNLDVGLKNINRGTARHFYYMQFTGYQDKKGVDIYENDITIAANLNETYQVVWVASGWKLMSLNRNDRRINSFQPVLHQEVIGNIYQQPYLDPDSGLFPNVKK